MAYVLNRQIITKKIIDLFVDFLRSHLGESKIYETTKVSDRFAYDSAQVPCVIIRNTSNTSQRVHYDDFIEDIYSRVQLIPISTDNNIVGNNAQRINIPAHVEENNLWPWDATVGIPSGTDISRTIFTNTSGNYNVTDISTGIIITVPSASTFIPQSIERVEEVKRYNEYSLLEYPSSITSEITYSLAIGLSNNQFYLLYSGTNFSGVHSQTISAEQVLNNATDMSGVSIRFNDTLYAGDQYVIKTYPSEAYVGERFGGIYDVNINFDVYGMSTIETQELCDLIQRFLVERKFDLWDRVGFTAKSWSKGGESEQPHLNEYIFKASLTTDGIVEWHEDRMDIYPLVSGLSIYSFPTGSYTDTILISGESYIQASPLTSGIASVPIIHASHIYNVSRIYPSGGAFVYPYSGSIVESSGAGWYSGVGTINWTNGSYPDYSIPVTSGWVPSGNSTYYMDYTYFGIVYSSPII